jgi:hypothetical protein
MCIKVTSIARAAGLLSATVLALAVLAPNAIEAGARLCRCQPLLRRWTPGSRLGRISLELNSPTIRARRRRDHSKPIRRSSNRTKLSRLARFCDRAVGGLQNLRM